MLRIENLKLSPGGGPSALRNAVLHILRIPEKDLLALHILRRSIDAREGVRMVYTVEVEAAGHSFRASSSSLKFSGYTAVYEEGKDEEKEEKESPLPALREGEPLTLKDFDREQHFTQPPAHYTDATLIRAMEEQGIGRPSTYAPTVSTILDREYVVKEGKYLHITNLGRVVTQLMEEYFRAVSECDMDTFMNLFTSQDTSQEEQFRQSFEKQREYIDGYENISCYTAKGLTKDAYVAYVSYDVRFSGVDTPAPSLVEVYVEKCSDGQWRIFDGEKTPELEAYLEAVNRNEDTVLLGKQIDEAKEAAMNADEELKGRILFMENGPGYMQDEE
mgnify:CR=1 FL=1